MEVLAIKQEVLGITKGKTIRRKEKKSGGGRGCDLRDVKLEDGTTIDAGRILIRDQWNTGWHGPLEAAYQVGLKAKVPDERFRKARLSGMWSSNTACTNFLEKQGIRALLYLGVSTDQCVLATA